MNTALIASPEITGNIGSCTTQATKVITGRTLWIEDIQTIATNSCTGQVTTYDTWAFTGGGGWRTGICHLRCRNRSHDNYSLDSRLTPPPMKEELCKCNIPNKGKAVFHCQKCGGVKKAEKNLDSERLRKNPIPKVRLGIFTSKEHYSKCACVSCRPPKQEAGKKITDQIPTDLIQIGEYRIGEYDKDTLWIENMDGEGMTTGKEFLIIPLTHKFRNEF